MKLAKRLSQVKPSATMAVTERSAALRAQGIDVIDFGAGEPDFDTPDHIKQAAVAALAKGAGKYTPVGGTAALKQAILAKLKRDNGLEYEPSEVIASCGGKHALYISFQVLFEEGDEILVPAPFWVSYPDMLALAGASARILMTEESNGFKLTPAELRDAIGPQTRAIILNSPSNPAGVAYTEEELRGLLEVVRDSSLIVITDDVYEMMVYDGTRPRHVLQLEPSLRERSLVINSVSKTYAMTGWRIGYTAAPKPVIAAMGKIQGQMTSNPSAVAQAAAVEALGGPQGCVAPMMAEFKKRRDFIVERLNRIPGVRCPKPQGAFYVFPNIEPHLGRSWERGRLANGDDIALYFLEKAHTAVVGGTDFGYPGHIRISYANSLENLARGADAIEQALARLGA